MGHTGGDAHQHGNLHLLGVVKCLPHHVVGFLLTGRFVVGNHRETAVEAGILFILRGMHRGVVGGHHHQASVGSGHGGVDEGVGGHVHADVFHADHGALAHIGHAESRLHGGLLVGAPLAEDTLRGRIGLLTVLDVLGNLRRGSSGIGVDTGNARMYSRQCYGFIAK